jgi:hypothetical protein
MNKYDIVLYRGSKRVVLKFGKVGPSPEHADGRHYSHEPEVLIASASFEDEGKAIKLGHWMAKRLLVPTDEVKAYDTVVEVQEESISDRVMTYLASGPKKIGEIASEVGRPSAAIFSILSAAMRKEAVSCAEKTYSLALKS